MKKTDLYSDSPYSCEKRSSICSTGIGSFLRNMLGIFFFLLIFISCSTANLISEERKHGFAPLAAEISIEQLRQEVLGTIDPFKRYQKDESIEVIATDIWESNFIRWLTPLDMNEQKFKANLRLYHQGIEYTFLNGKQTGQTIGFDGQSYQYAGTQKNYEKSAAISLYLGPLQSYLEWNQTLLRNPTLTLLGTKEITNIPYWVCYATEGPTQELDQHDQFLIYINQRSGQIDYIEFTMRNLMNSYKGVIHYRNYNMVQRILMPFWIGIADDLLQPDFDHYFVVESIQFSKGD